MDLTESDLVSEMNRAVPIRASICRRFGLCMLLVCVTQAELAMAQDREFSPEPPDIVSDTIDLIDDIQPIPDNAATESGLALGMPEQKSSSPNFRLGRSIKIYSITLGSFDAQRQSYWQNQFVECEWGYAGSAVA